MVKEAENLQGAPGTRCLHRAGNSCSSKKLAYLGGGVPEQHWAELLQEFVQEQEAEVGASPFQRGFCTQGKGFKLVAVSNRPSIRKELVSFLL